MYWTGSLRGIGSISTGRHRNGKAMGGPSGYRAVAPLYAMGAGIPEAELVFAGEFWARMTG